ncbi:MAG TPA: hypothetical protein VFU59_05820 [Candidatus Eisenbacteria bacterium]|nr:hypothetical protein [Candidatus Eisenbacteria bacterium]
MRHFPRFLTAAAAILVVAASIPSAASARTLVANPSAVSGQAGYYRSLVSSMVAGDTLVLPSGVYPDRLSLDGKNGTASAWIVIMGPASGPPATITTTSTCCNTVQLGGTSYVALKNITIDSAGLSAIDGLNAKGNPTHHILIENCTFIGQDAGQGTVGISTKSPAWNWTIRGNRIIEAGTGLYLGNSDGTQPFIAGIIEGNLVQNTIGYNMEIKNQLAYGSLAWAAALPPEPHRTIIRHNVFIKEKNDWDPSKLAGVRPNLLVDPFPDTGVGSQDMYEIYGNFFYKNPNESLLQATGRMSVHDNVFVASAGGKVSALFTDHNGPIKLAHVYNNTVYSTAGGGFHFSVGPRDGGYVRGNTIVTAGPSISGAAPAASGNLIGTPTDGSSYFTAPSEVLGQMDFYPSTSCAACSGTPLDLSPFAVQADYDKDFNGTSKGDFRYRGAYAGQGANPGWRLAAAPKPLGSTGGSSDTTPPGAPLNLRAP